MLCDSNRLVYFVALKYIFSVPYSIGKQLVKLLPNFSTSNVLSSPSVLVLVAPAHLPLPGEKVMLM